MRLYKLKKTDEFSSVFDFKKRYYGEWLFAHIKPNTYAHHRFGLVVSKRVAKLAVRRNYMKRVLRALIQSYKGNVNQGHDIVLQVRKPYRAAEFTAVAQDFYRLLQRLSRQADAAHSSSQRTLSTEHQHVSAKAGL